jgi:hypothetical protein
MPIGLIAAGVGAAGAIGSAVIGANANSRAAKVAAENNAANNRLSQQQYDSTKALIQPYVDKGNVAADTLQGFLGLGGDPAKSKAAFDDFLNSTGYQFNRQEGIDSAEQSASASGLLNSGAALKALQDRGTGLAQRYGQQYVDNLNGVATRGTNAIGALTGAGNANVSNQTANNNTGAAAQANAVATNGNIFGGLINSLTGSAVKVIGASSFGGGNAMTGGAASNPYSIPGFTGVG